MAGLDIRLDQNDRMIINGAAIHFLTSAQIRLLNRTQFLFGKQIMPPEAATTPARHIYYALQTAYVGTEEEREKAMKEAIYFINAFSRETTSETAKALLKSAYDAACEKDYYTALRYALRVIRHEDAVISSASGLTCA
ncbi:MAG: flagellar biosynthesis repressor FlbT [Acetobacter sp.]|jgi:flagellar protein FlbT|nr:flagellar biosynthesis repressor FlbT [Acetobacter sp.]MCH4062255.1 flagellar biosynthesis repressor FlbT [Acetobacter sp.]MCH4088898.1 flagellar biosynthesis repressor FlbT [Acetobacter sp.]MCI1292801.1 flagellar biosynthesis repressor FlbT [Acetobacter sp.]MCI1319098.1 flagellar biosynthesis repressor FlbT [Acetobacter sp.]